VWQCTLADLQYLKRHWKAEFKIGEAKMKEVINARLVRGLDPWGTWAVVESVVGVVTANKLRKVTYVDEDAPRHDAEPIRNRAQRSFDRVVARGGVPEDAAIMDQY